MREAGFRNVWDMIRKRKIRIKDNNKISSRRNRLYCKVETNARNVESDPLKGGTTRKVDTDE